MKSSCISHPQREPLIIIRKWQVRFCDNDACAAALLSFFEYWHNIKLEQSAKAAQINAVEETHGDPPHQDTTLIQFHNEQDLVDGILIHKRDNIRQALALLESKGAITILANPNPRYKFDKTRHFIFHPDVCTAFLVHCVPKSDNPSSENRRRSSENRRRSSENRRRSAEKRPTIPETTTEREPDPASPPQKSEKRQAAPVLSDTEDAAPQYAVPYKTYKALANLYAEQLPEGMAETRKGVDKVAFDLRDAFDHRIKAGEVTIGDLFGRVRAHGALPKFRKWHNLEPHRLMDPEVEYYLTEQHLGIKAEEETRAKDSH